MSDAQTEDEDPLLWSVDRSWGDVAADIDGNPYRETKLHIDRGDSTARCSRRVLLNAIDATTPVGYYGSLYPDSPVGHLSEFELFAPHRICRRCSPLARSEDDPA